MRRAWFLLAGTVIAVACGACVFQHMSVREVDLRAEGTEVQSPTKAHLRDGSVVLFAHGVRLDHDSLRGSGMRYDATLRDSTRVAGVPLDSTVGLEEFDAEVNVPATMIGSAVGVAGATVGGALLAVAIFGSCPTVYADSAGTPVLQAEAFSYSIAPLFEARDVDLLRAGPDQDGQLRLEVRNEALETHYINHLELLEVVHDSGESVAPDPHGDPVAYGDTVSASRALDRDGRDLRAVLESDDGHVAQADPGRLARASARDPDDWIDLNFATPSDEDSVALILRARSSLLTTVLLYDQMLAAQGVRAIDWVGHDLARIDNAVALGRWYVQTMGMRISVRTSGAWRQVAWLRDVGPIAWKDVAVMLPTSGDTLHVRLSFVTDGWRLDRAVLARTVRRPSVRSIPVTTIATRDGRADSAGAALAAPDTRYLETTPGTSFTVRFDVGTASTPRSFLLRTQGYYIEWLRADWLRHAPGSFTPSDTVVGAALARWRAVHKDYERRFFASRLPTR